MNISAKWTLQERLALIDKKSMGIIRLVDEPFCRLNPGALKKLTVEINELSNSTAEYLEKHRSRLLEGIE